MSFDINQFTKPNSTPSIAPTAPVSTTNGFDVNQFTQPAPNTGQDTNFNVGSLDNIDKAEILASLTGGAPDSRIGNQNTQDMYFEDQNNLKNAIVQDKATPDIWSQLGNYAHLTLGPELLDRGVKAISGGKRDLIDSTIDQFRQHTPDSVTAAATGAYNMLTLGFDKELVGMAQSVKGMLSGEVSPEHLLNAYRANRDLYSAQEHKLTMDHPIATLAGQVVGALAVPNPFGAGKIALSAPMAVRLLANMKQGAALGSLYSIGQSNADLTKGEFLPAMGDAAMGGLLGLVVGGLVTGVQNIAGAGRLSYTLSPGGKEAVGAAIGSGGTGNISKEWFTKMPNIPGTDSREIFQKLNRATSFLEDNNILAIRRYSYGNGAALRPGEPVIDLQRRPSVGGQAMDDAWNNFKDFIWGAPKNFDYEGAQNSVNSINAANSKILDDISSKAVNAPKSFEDVFGVGSFDRLKGAIRNWSSGGDVSRELAMNIRAQLETAGMDSEKFMFQNGAEIRSFLKSLGPSAWAGSKVLEGSNKAVLQNLWKNGMQFMSRHVATTLPEESNAYQSALRNAQSGALASELLDAGAALSQKAWIMRGGFEQVAAPTNPAMNILGTIGAAHGMPLNFLKGIGSLGSAGTRTAALGVQGLQSPLEMWAPEIFQSMTSDGKIRSPTDRLIASTYIEQNGTINNIEKMKQKMQLHRDGSFNLANVPMNVKKQAIDSAVNKYQR